MAVVVDGIQGEVLASLQNVVVPLTHAGFSIPSDGSPWREREQKRKKLATITIRFGLACVTVVAN